MPVNLTLCSSSQWEKYLRALTSANMVPESLSHTEDSSSWKRPPELVGNYIALSHKWIGSKLHSYTNWLKRKLLSCQARALHGFYELPWFIFSGEGSEQELSPQLLGSSWRITCWSFIARRTFHNNSIKDLIEHLNTKCVFLLSYQACNVVLINQLDFSGFYSECPFHVGLGITEIQNIATYKTKSF